MTAQFLYTQEQARSVTGIGQEALRHWRRIVPYLAKKTGKGARFSFGDLVGLAVMREITGTLGVSISQLHGGIEQLFLIFSEQAVIQSGSLAVLRSGTSSVDIVGMGLPSLNNEPTIMVPLDPLIEELRSKLLNGLRLPPQSVLPFPGEAVSERRT